MGPLNRLPNELLTYIFLYLSSLEDKKTFRLICRACDCIPLPFLFRRIYLSRTTKDWNTFENIATNPKVASYVRELVWYEVCLEALQKLEGWVPTITRNDDFITMTELQDHVVHDPEVFCIPKVEQGNWNRTPPTSLVLEARFCHLVRNLLGLTTIISCPMPHDREISCNDYLVSGYMSAFLPEKYIAYFGNQGFEFFLQQAMVEEPRITNLRFMAENFTTPTWNMRFILHPMAFKHLTSVELHLGKCCDETSATADQFFECLQACKLLEHLKLCFSRLCMGSNGQHMDRQNPKKRLGCHFSPEHYWAKLRSIHLECFNCLDDNKPIIAFLGRHAATLRSVVLVNIHITTQDILQLRSHKPRLYSLSVTACDADWWNLVDGDDLRAFINNATTSCETEYGALLPTSPRSNAIFVTEDVWDVSAVHNPNAAYDPNAKRKDELDSAESSEDGDPEDLDYDSYFPRRWDTSLDSINFDEVIAYHHQNRELDSSGVEWSFVHRDGRTAVGEDPLEYFSDWDSDAGDEASLIRHPLYPELSEDE